MKFKFTLTLLLLFTFMISFAQKLEKAPLNDEFIEFTEKKSTRKGGYIPSPTTYVHNKVDNKKITKTSFPSSYNLNTEGYVTSVKNQGGAGHCWSFAAIGAIESRNLVLGLGTYDLSEHNLATCHGFEWDEGGNQGMATAYFSRLSGPILESQDIYNDYENSCSATDIDPQFYVTESRFLPEDPDVVKYYLLNYGAIPVSYYENDLYFNATNNTYYYSGSEYPNHGVLLVGWDDNKTTSGGKGAWIIKNSWGSYWGDNGYFYMSYNDTHAIGSPAIYPVRKELNNIDTLLMIDELGEITSYGFRDEKDYALIKYNVSEQHDFNQIGTYIGASNSLIDIEVFQTKTNNNLSDTIAKIYNLYADYPGYHTFDIPFSVNGDFYIKIGYNCPGDNFPIPVETAANGYSIPQIESNVCWVSDEGKVWEKIGTGTSNAADLCIRAYGSKSDIKASFSADYETICYDSDVTFSSNSSGTITGYSWNFGEDASPATASTEGPHTVTYSSQGFKTIKLVIEDGGGKKDSLINYNYIKVSNEIKVTISASDSTYVKEDSIIELVAHGAETYLWEPISLVTGSNTNSIVKVSTVIDKYVSVTGTMGSCVSKDSIRLVVMYAPENDNVCDATDLSLSITHGPFTNALATVQENEPHPALGACDAPLTWCNEGGLQNSVWFKFTASKHPLKIITKGFDNQIALYDAATCDDIISGNAENYSIIAANDDVDDFEFAATINELTNLTEGKIYWLQVDGSAGGSEGQFTIKLEERWPAGINDISEENIKIYPNPSNGEFKIDLSSLNNIDNNTKVDIFSTTGSLIYTFKGNTNQSVYDLSIKRKGMLIIQVTTLANKYSLPIIIN